jgi:hypothetical protein
MQMISALECNIMKDSEVSPQLMQMLGLPEGANVPPDLLQHLAKPSEEQQDLFCPKATEIFMSLPAREP